MTSLFEDSLLYVVLGTITAVVLGFAWLQTGRKQLAYALAIIVFLTLAVVIVERVVVTDREAVSAVLRAAARDIERNDLRGLLQHLHSQAPQIRAQAEAEFPKYRFESVSIKPNLEITFDGPKDPNEAVAKFNVMVIGSHRDDTIEHWRAPRYVIVTFRKERGEWRVFAYEHHNPQQGMLKREGN